MTVSMFTLLNVFDIKFILLFNPFHDILDGTADYFIVLIQLVFKIIRFILISFLLVDDFRRHLLDTCAPKNLNSEK